MTLATAPTRPAGYFAGTRPDVVALVPSSAQVVLDCGCGEGGLGTELTKRGHVVTGVEPWAPAAAVAERRLHRVLGATIEDALDRIPARSVDCVICADVLEHLADPWAVTAALAMRLRPGGVFICSTPNVRHLGVLVDLVVRGRWRYQASGVLDRSHLRFFTRSSLLELVEGAGLHVDLVVANREAYHGGLRLAAACVGLLSHDLCAAQWLVRAFAPRL